MRNLSYDGTMVFQKLNDEMIRTNYQHKHVVDAYIEHFKNKKVLDAGCWTGTIEKEIRSREFPCEIVGIDINKEALEVARKNFPNVEFHQIELTNPSKGFIERYKDYFDTIVFLDVIEHVPPGTESEVLKVFHSLLKPNGVLIVSTMLNHLFNIVDPAWMFGHRHYKVNQIHKFYSEAGFDFPETLLLGNLYWDLDLLMLYVYKHIFRKEYKTSEYMYNKIIKGLKPSQGFATRIYSLVKKRTN